MSKVQRADRERARQERHNQIVAGSERYAECDDEPVEKKSARMETWLYLARWYQSDFRKQRFLVLSSAEAGDVSCLLGLGVPLENICAVDLSAAAVAAARAKFPGLTVEQGDVFDVAQRWPHDIGMFDFCGPVTQDLTTRLARYLGSTRVEALCVGFMRGRERPEDRFSVARKDMIARYKVRLGAKTDEQLLRENAFEVALAVETCRRGALIKAPFVMQYQTRVPMTYTWFDVEHGGSVRSRWARLMKEGYAPAERDFLRSPKFSEEQWRDLVARLVGKLPARIGAMLLNLAPPRLAAWKAWAARRRVPTALDIDGGAAAIVRAVEGVGPIRLES